MNSINGAEYVVKAIHKTDHFSVVSDLYREFNELLVIRRGQSENIKSFESRFEAQLSRFNAHGAGKIPEPLVALLLLSNANIEDSQHGSTLEASILNVTTNDNDTAPKTEELLLKVK